MPSPEIQPAIATALRQYAAFLKATGRTGGSSFNKMAPWDELAYFFTPTQTEVLIQPAPNPTPICLANPNRVALMIANFGNNVCQVGINGDMPANVGINLSNGTLPLILNFKDHGPLPQLQWFAMGGVGGFTISVFEVVLREWPY